MPGLAAVGGFGVGGVSAGWVGPVCWPAHPAMSAAPTASRRIRMVDFPTVTPVTLPANQRARRKWPATAAHRQRLSRLNDLAVVNPDLVADREAGRDRLVSRAVSAIGNPDADLVAHGFFHVLFDFVAGIGAARRTAYRRDRIAIAATDLIADQRAGHAAGDHADSVSLAFDFRRRDGIHDAALGTRDGFSFARPTVRDAAITAMVDATVRVALGILRRAGRRFCARQPARDGGC